MKRYSFNATTPFEFELKNLSEITQAKQQISGVPHRTDFYQIVWIESGNSLQTVDFSPLELNAGQLLFIAKNQVVSFDASAAYNGQIILFTDAFYNRCGREAQLLKQLNLFNPFAGNAPITISEKLINLWLLMNEEIRSSYDAFQVDSIHSLLTAFLLEAARQNTQNASYAKNKDYQTALQFAELVEQHYQSMRKVNDYLPLMNITAKSLTKALQTTLGKTPKQFIDERILLEAKRLLVYTNDTVKEITFMLGFDEPTNFSKFFREQSNMSPAEFKKLHSA